jgi:subtilisin family serine protease
MDPLKQIKLSSIMKQSQGNSKIIVGIIDGPFDGTHSAFSEMQTITVNKKYNIRCNNSHIDNSYINSLACIHGTVITGILAAKRGVDAPSICPSCTFAVRPLFLEQDPSPKASTQDLANAVIETVDAGSNIINLSLGMENPLGRVKHLEDACLYARNNNVIIVVSAGNQSRLGGNYMLNNEWVIPIAACDHDGIPLNQSNFGISIARYGLMAPGFNIKSTFPKNEYKIMSGTSVATAFVTGTLALLWSLFPKASSSEIIYSIRLRSKNKTIIPNILDAQNAYQELSKKH